MFVVGFIHPVTRRESVVSCPLASHKEAIAWINNWRGAGEQFANDVFRIVKIK